MHAKIVRIQLRTMVYVLRRWGGVGISAPVLWAVAEANKISVSLLELITGMRERTTVVSGRDPMMSCGL